MIGVDIIDRQAILPRTNEKLKRYRDRIMEQEEQVLVDHLFDYQLTSWVAWCVKESVYKLEYKVDAHRVLAPKSMRLRNITHVENDIFQFTVDGRLDQYFVQLYLKESHLYSIVSTSLRSSGKTYFYSFPINNDPDEASAMCRKQVRSFLEKEFCNASVSIVEGEYPKLFSSNQEWFDLSISHHGNWGCFGIQKL